MMKTQYVYYLLLTILPALTMCQNGNSDTKKDPGRPVPEIDKHCYIAIDQKDTAYLNLLTYGRGKAKGRLLILPSGKSKKTGDFTGQVKGDTLFLDYRFYMGADSLIRFTNPLALLKKKDSLILGVGKVQSYLGRTYFDKHTPIRFENGRFRFSLIKCK